MHLYALARRTFRYLMLTIVAVVVSSVVGFSVLAQAGEDKVKILPTIVLIHGAFAESASWNDVISHLQGSGYTAIATPNPLQGLSSDA